MMSLLSCTTTQSRHPIRTQP